MDLGRLIVDVSDFPEPGVVFADISPLLGDGPGFAAAVDGLVAAAPDGVDAVVGLEARGFLFAAPVALALGVGVVPVRKPGKLPRRVLTTSYDLEYGTETLAVHADALAPGSRVLVVDDVLATGGTVAAAAGLVDRLGGRVVGVAVVVELAYLAPRRRLAELDLGPVSALVTVPG